jgi:hypothetical protein
MLSVFKHQLCFYLIPVHNRAIKINITYVGSPSQGPLGSRRLFLGLFSSLPLTAKLQTEDNHILAHMRLIRPYVQGFKIPQIVSYIIPGVLNITVTVFCYKDKLTSRIS